MRANFKYNVSWLAVMVIGFVAIDACEFLGIINAFIENMLVTIGINIILATGLNLIIGFSGQFSLGHAGFMAIGAYATGIMTQTIATPLGFYLSMVVGIVIAMIAALIVGIPTLRLRGDYLAIATMGAAEIIRILINNLKITNGAAGLFNIPPLVTWATVYVLMCLTTIVTVNFIHSRNGRAIMSVREDEIAAEAMGINPTRWKLAAFVLGALDTILQNFGTLRMIIYSLALILIMIFKPSGLLGNRELSFKRLGTHQRKEQSIHE